MVPRIPLPKRLRHEPGDGGPDAAADVAAAEDAQETQVIDLREPSPGAEPEDDQAPPEPQRTEPEDAAEEAAEDVAPDDTPRRRIPALREGLARSVGKARARTARARPAPADAAESAESADGAGDAGTADAPETPGNPEPARPGRLTRLSRARTTARRAGTVAVLHRRLAGRHPPAASLAIATAWSLGVLLLAALVADLLIGTTSAGTSMPVWDRFLSVWRAGHLTPIRTAAGPVTLVPMAPAVLVALVQLRAAGWLWAAVQGRVARPQRILMAFAAATSAIALAVAALPTVDPVAGSPLAGVLALGLLSTGPPLFVRSRHVLRRDRPRVWLLLRSAATILLLVGAAAMAMLTLTAVLSRSGLLAGSEALLSGSANGSTWRDTAALIALQLAYLPNLVVWAGAYLLGAGFAVGAGTIVSPFTVQVGGLPALPAVAMLPEHGLSMALLPPFLMAVLAVLGGHVLRGISGDLPMRGRIALAGMVTALVAAGAVVLSFLAGGGLGPGRLDPMGPSPFAVLVASVVVVGAGLLFWAVLPTVLSDVRPHAAAAIARIQLAAARRRRRKQSARAG